MLTCALQITIEVNHFNIMFVLSMLITLFGFGLLYIIYCGIPV